jgi:hypothetical protein
MTMTVVKVSVPVFVTAVRLDGKWSIDKVVVYDEGVDRDGPPNATDADDTPLPSNHSDVLQAWPTLLNEEWPASEFG